MDKLIYATANDYLVLVDLETGTVLGNPKQVVLIPWDKLEEAQSDSQTVRIARNHGLTLDQVDWSE